MKKQMLYIIIKKMTDERQVGLAQEREEDRRRNETKKILRNLNQEIRKEEVIILKR